jgi:hypothetical protein
MPIKMREQSEIDEQINRAAEAADSGSRWPGMSYEEGVDSALSWVCGLSDEAPMEAEE